MANRVVDRVLREPDGWSSALARFTLGVGFLGPAFYFALAFDSWSVLLFCMGVAFVLQGLADVLPDEHRHAAGSLRLVAVGVASALLIVVVVDPSALL